MWKLLLRSCGGMKGLAVGGGRGAGGVKREDKEEKKEAHKTA